MDTKLTRDQALETLKKYNTEPFHILHALTVEGAMRWFAKDQGFEDEEDFWGLVGLLHDVDFEMYPQEHCIKAPELLRQAGAEEELIRAVCSHGYGIMDELTGLIGAAARMRPSGSVMDMEVSSLKKKFKDKRFAAGCSRDVIKSGAESLGWSLEELMEKAILAMRSCEESVNEQMEALK